MITVRFPSGFSVQYNDLDSMKWGSDNAQLLFRSNADRDTGKGWVVSVPADCIVEFMQPCRTYMAGESDMKTELRDAQHKLELARKQIARLKKEKEQQ